jgi:hypothetical protein
MFGMAVSYVRAIAEVCSALVTAWAMVRYVPVLMDRAKLLHDNTNLRNENASLQAMVKTMALGTDGWQKKLDGIFAEMTAMRNDINEMRATQIVATRFIADLVRYIRAGGGADDMPNIPAELRDEVLELMRIKLGMPPC